MNLWNALDESLLAVSAKAFMDENACLEGLLPHVQWFTQKAPAIAARAKRYIETVRAQKKSGGIEAFHHEYSLNSQEGIIIMCLAEALLRIPDAATADALIHDKLASGDWDRHIGQGRPWLVSLGGMGLELAEKVTNPYALRQSAGEFIGNLIQRLSEPVVRAALRQAMKLMGSVFVFGATIEEAKRKAGSQRRQQNLFSFDMLGEGARSAAQAEEYFDKYLHSIRVLAGQEGPQLQVRDGISIKLSALHPRLELRQWEVLCAELLPKVRILVREAARHGIPITIDAEEANRLDVMLMVFRALFTDPEFASYAGLGLVVQAYQKRAGFVIDYLRGIAETIDKRIPLRLVKGAYWDSEIKRSQMEGLEDYPVFTHKAHTDVSYLACAGKLLRHPHCFYPQFATHNALTVAGIIELAKDGEYEFQRLHGMGEALYDAVLGDTQSRCRIYAPVGTPAHLLSYLIRRILENGANNSFVRGLYDAPLDRLLADPTANIKPQSVAPAIPLPENLYPDRLNSLGYDLGNAAQLYALHKNIAAQSMKDRIDIKDATPRDCDAAFERAGQALEAWKSVDRAACLERIAVLFAQHEDAFIAYCMQEAGKTVADSIAEVREAIDYCRYYASEARKLLTPLTLYGPSGEQNTLCLQPRGTIVAISPWNFPLAIFTGQVVAALVTGNCVIAKPAEETPGIAAYAVNLMHQAGVPKNVLQLLCGSGEETGAKLIRDPRTAGVAFTGSTHTAWAINRALAARDAPVVPLIAETGGQNCMVIDSSALIEQTVDDILISAFGSAGQRCSSLRVAFVQEEIADRLLAVLQGAMQQLRVGDVSDFSTDIGPVISKEAHETLAQHITMMKQKATLIAAAPAVDLPLFIAPHTFEIASIDMLKGEVFGPVLHVIRYKADALADVVRQINSTGYGLTFGIQSRIDARIRWLCERVRAGNIYVNRSMIGATVGVQPFGGQGLSGTGPKAGGPHYLPRFCVEQTLTINTAAIGGNLELLL